LVIHFIGMVQVGVGPGNLKGVIYEKFN